MFLLNSLKGGDIFFFVLCIVIVVAIVGIYFLIPVIKKDQLEEARHALETREKAFKENRNASRTSRKAKKVIESIKEE